MKHVHTFESFLNEAASVPSNIMDFAKRKGSAATALVKKAATWAEKAGKRISGGTAIGKNYSTIILDMKYQGAEIYINLDDETIELFGEEVTDAKSFQKVLNSETNESAEVNEIVGVKPTDAGKAAHWINSEYEKDGFDNEAFGYALKGYFKDEYPSEKLQSEILDLLRAKYKFEFEPSKSALIISQRMY